MSNTPKPRRTLADIFRSRPGRELASLAAGGLASGLLDLVDVAGVAGAVTNVTRVRCTCGAHVAAAEMLGAAAGAAFTVGQLGAFVAVHGDHGPLTVTTRDHDGTTSENVLSPELASFAGGAARGVMTGSLARAARSAAELFAKKGPSK